MINVHQRFNSVGHGTFFNGFAFEMGRVNEFSWIYDCGSKRTTRLDQEITRFDECWQAPEEIDLLVLSHFDDDHVNGVERLLKSRKVRNLALPYMDIGQRLACAAAIDSDSSSASTASLQLDPVAWLHAHGLADQVTTVLMVQGGTRDDDDPPIDAPPAPLPSSPTADEPFQNEKGHSSERAHGPRHPLMNAHGTSIATGPQLLTHKHTRSVGALGLPLELMFFNATQPDLFRHDATGMSVARRSHCEISVVQSEVDKISRSYGLYDLSRKPRKGWRDALRAVYVKHFGNSSQQRNNISLCLLVRPYAIRIGYFAVAENFDEHHFFYDGKILNTNKAGTLLLGDLRIDAGTLEEMTAHFGLTRWASIGTVQVPHHGSKHSWESGAAAAFSAELFVHCIPDSSSHHPHKSVEDDLNSVATVLRADYRTSVVINYWYIP
ncbi:hypothetical protein [Pandoraea sp. ISTKB]|uniref:hypothetical protein n=1 Tax=Pandoraea sp. ISTKB TaxID=1586708 RepID=UPI000A5DDA3D|nr:hypothetical protein [Pandoraea sp. ISTKB]